MSSYPSEWPRQVLSIWQVPFRVIDLAYRDISAVGCRECCLLPRLYNDEGKLCYTWVLCIKLSWKPLRFYLWHQLIVGLFASFHTLPSNPANFLSKFRCIFGRAHVDEEVTKCGNLDVDITNDLKWIECKNFPSATKAIPQILKIHVSIPYKFNARSIPYRE